MSEINVTPFVDIMLVLLIIFMVAAPLLSVGIEVDLPNTSAKPLSTEKERPLTLTMDEESNIFINEVKIMNGVEEFSEEFSVIISRHIDMNKNHKE